MGERRIWSAYTRWFLVVLLNGCAAASLAGHEIRPALLQISELEDGRCEVLWKQPSIGGLRLHLAPRIAGGLLTRAPDELATTPDFQVSIWKNLSLGARTLAGRTVEVDGIEQTITDVLVSFVPLQGSGYQGIINARNPRVTLDVHRSGVALAAYFRLGVEHILTGFDHLCFILGLMLLVRRRIALFKTITAFTVAHSLTLASVALHLIRVRAALVEALVALSIIFVAVEIGHHYCGRDGLAVRRPWVIAFFFGLLHGTAFAGALNEIGLPPHAIPASLLSFNLGVEVGQLTFVALVLGAAFALRQWVALLPGWTRWVLPYAIGTFSASCFVDRVMVAWR